MTDPLTAAECVEICEALWPERGPWSCGEDDITSGSGDPDSLDAEGTTRDYLWCQGIWDDIHAAIDRLAEMGMGEGLAFQMAALLPRRFAMSISDMLTAPIEVYARAILETVRAYKAQEQRR